jgi:hypothetical protein
VTEFVTVPAGRVSLAIESALVERVVAAGEWTGAAPIDLLAAVGLPPEEHSAEPRIVVLRGDRALRIEGRLSVRSVEEARVQPLPAALGPSVLDRIVFEQGDEAPLLVVAVDRLQKPVRP